MNPGCSTTELELLLRSTEVLLKSTELATEDTEVLLRSTGVPTEGTEVILGSTKGYFSIGFYQFKKLKPCQMLGMVVLYYIVSCILQ